MLQITAQVPLKAKLFSPPPKKTSTREIGLWTKRQTICVKFTQINWDQYLLSLSPIKSSEMQI